MSRYCIHNVQASVNRDSSCIDQWTNGRLCSVKTHAYWKRPWSNSVSVLMCESGSSVSSVNEQRGGQYENRVLNPSWAKFINRVPGACPASCTDGTGILSEV
jgi:hypothetical protein